MRIPRYIIKRFERESDGVEYGEVYLKLFIKYGKLRYEVGRNESFLLENRKEEADQMLNELGDKNERQ